MDSKLIEKIHAGHGQFALALTGGGTTAVADLFSVAGASASMLDVVVPYHPAALGQYTGAADNGCNPVTARRMAMAAFQRAQSIRNSSESTAVNVPVFGIGLTAAIATNRERRGADRCHAVLQSDSRTLALDLMLDKGLTRSEQEAICNRAVIWLMQEAQSSDDSSDNNSETGGFSLRSSEGELAMSQVTAPDEWQALLADIAGELAIKPWTCSSQDRLIHCTKATSRYWIRHSKRTGRTATLEISISNVDKPPLDFLSMQERADQLTAFDLVFTNAPTFVEKSALFPGAVFIVGADTITRIAESKYYTAPDVDNETARDRAIDLMAERGNRFLVFGRDADGQFETLASTRLPPALAAICDGVPESEFRADISSSAIRAGLTS